MSDAAPRSTLTIGQVAERSGLTPRTLRFYEQRGLVPEPERSAGGHRLYAESHIGRIYQVQMLRGLGLSVAETASALTDSSADLTSTLRSHLHTIDEEIAARTRLRSQLVRLSGATATASTLNAEDLLTVIEEMNNMKSTIDKRISILVYADIEAAVQWLGENFLLGPATITKGDDGVVHLAEVEAGDGVLWLHPESPDFKLASPATVSTRTGMMAVMVDDVDAHHAHAAAQGVTIRYEPVDQPYGYREYGAEDCEGHLWSFMKPLD